MRYSRRSTAVALTAAVTASLVALVGLADANTATVRTIPLAPAAGMSVQGSDVLFRVRVPEDIAGNVTVRVGPPSMRVLPSSPNGLSHVEGLQQGGCEASWGVDRLAECVSYGTLPPGGKVWYVEYRISVWDPDAGEYSYPYRVDGPYTFSVSAPPRLCLLTKQPGRVVVTPRVVRIGQTVTVRGSGFIRGVPVKVWPQTAPGLTASGPRADERVFVPRSGVDLTGLGVAYPVRTARPSASGRFQVAFGMPQRFLLDPSLAGGYIVFVAAQPRTSVCSRFPGYEAISPTLHTYGLTLLLNPARG